MLSDTEIEFRGGCILAIWLVIKGTRLTSIKDLIEITGYSRKSIVGAADYLTATGNIRKRRNILNLREVLYEKVE